MNRGKGWNRITKMVGGHCGQTVWAEETIVSTLEINIYSISDSEWFVSTEGPLMPSMNERDSP